MKPIYLRDETIPLKYEEIQKLFLKIKKNRWIVQREIHYYSKRYKKWVIVYKGFEFDSYTIVPNLSCHLPSCIHDFLFKYKKFSDGSKCSRRQADIIFKDIMKATPTIGTFWMRVYFLGVRLFSAPFWYLKRSEELSEELFEKFTIMIKKMSSN